MDVLCHKCGAQNWLENQSRCLQCSAILRRCVDCANYDKRTRQCSALRAEIDVSDAESPSLLSTSTNCREYRPALRAA